MMQINDDRYSNNVDISRVNIIPGHKLGISSIVELDVNFQNQKLHEMSQLLLTKIKGCLSTDNEIEPLLDITFTLAVSKSGHCCFPSIMGGLPEPVPVRKMLPFIDSSIQGFYGEAAVPFKVMGHQEKLGLNSRKYFHSLPNTGTSSIKIFTLCSQNY